jgi:endonuclease/exonuclease/phosphatase family metal-dependent hydrolase
VYEFLVSPMIPRFSWFAMILFVASPAACNRARALGPPKAVPVAADGKLELRLMSFNVRYENGEDAGSRAWRNRIVGAVRMIRDERPDVIGVQEALHGQAADLWASLPDYEFFGAARDDGHRAGEYSGIFFRRDRFEVDRSEGGTFWLSDAPEKPGSKTWGNEIPRTATWLRLVDRSTGRGFHVFNTHWDHRHQGSRERSAELLAERIRGRGKREEPVVMMGDFNAVERNPGLAALKRDSRLIDVFQALHPQETERATLHFWRGTRAGSLKVDHILVSDGAEVCAAGIRDQDKPMVSDHFPVTARVVLPCARR